MCMFSVRIQAGIARQKGKAGRGLIHSYNDRAASSSSRQNFITEPEWPRSSQNAWRGTVAGACRQKGARVVRGGNGYGWGPLPCLPASCAFSVKCKGQQRHSTKKNTNAKITITTYPITNYQLYTYYHSITTHQFTNFKNEKCQKVLLSLSFCFSFKNI